MATGVQLVAAAGTFGVLAVSGLRPTGGISNSDWDQLRSAIDRLRRRAIGGACPVRESD